MPPSEAASAAEAAKPPYGPGYRWYALALLTLAYTAHAMDRAMPNILVEPVRREFHLTDSQLALFTGTGFGVAFALAVLPMGYFSDRANRRNFLAGILLAWSACTALGGFTRSFFQLALTRIGVGAAESGAAPVILPLIADIFPARQRSFATGVLYVGVPAGATVATLLGGYIAAEHGWRAALFLAGVPGLVVGLLLFTTIKEPPRDGAAEGEIPTPHTLAEVARFLAREPGLICVMVASAMIGLIAIGLMAWSSSFFVRIWGMNLKQVALLVGLGAGAAGVIAPLIYGWLADRFTPRAATAPLIITLVICVLAPAAGLAWLFAPVLGVAIAGYLAGELLRAGYPALTYPVLIAHTPPAMRGIVMSVLQLITNLFGFVLGPLLVGLISDRYGGGRAVRFGMANVLGLYALVIVFLLAAIWLMRKRGARAAG